MRSCAGKAPLAAILDQYLSGEHRDDPGRGCLYAALAADIARHDSPALRRVLTDSMRAMITFLARVIPGRSTAARRQQALAQLSAMVGALVLARAVDDPDLSDEILAAARCALGES